MSRWWTQGFGIGIPSSIFVCSLHSPFPLYYFSIKAMGSNLKYYIILSRHCSILTSGNHSIHIYKSVHYTFFSSFQLLFIMQFQLANLQSTFSQSSHTNTTMIPISFSLPSIFIQCLHSCLTIRVYLIMQMNRDHI